MTRHRILLSLWALLLVVGGARAQEALVVSGQVIDSATRQPLPFAQLSLATSHVGTAANGDGRFVLNIPSMLRNDTILFGYMGYATRKCPVWRLAGKDTVVALAAHAMQLAEVEIVGLTPEEVLRRVVANIPANYSADSLVLTAYVRSQKYAGSRLAEFTEAIIEDLKTGYTIYPEKKEREKQVESNVPLLLRGRVISDTALVNAMGEVGRSAGCLGCNFVHDFAEFYHNTVLDEKFFPDYRFRMEEVAGPAGEKLYRISFDQRPGVKKRLWKGTLVVQAGDFALLSVSQKPSPNGFAAYEKEKSRRPWFIDGQPGWIQEMPMLDWTVTYARRGDRYALSTISVNNTLIFSHPSRQGRVTLSHRNEVVVTDISTAPEKVRGFRGDKSTGVSQRWDQLVGNGDEAFWEGYNYLPIEEKLQRAIDQLRHPTP